MNASMANGRKDDRFVKLSWCTDTSEVRAIQFIIVSAALIAAFGFAAKASRAGLGFSFL